MVSGHYRAKKTFRNFMYEKELNRFDSFTFKNCVSGPVQSVLWLCVCHVRLGAPVQRVLQRKHREQGRAGVSALPQRDYIRLWWGMRKKFWLYIICCVTFSLCHWLYSSISFLLRSSSLSPNSVQWRRLRRSAVHTWLLQGWDTHLKGTNKRFA